MVVSIDKATAIRMYDKVQKYWLKHLEDLRGQLEGSSDEERRGWGEDLLHGRDGYGVVVSQSQNEVEDMRQKGLDIAPHRERIIREDLETKFKDSGPLPHSLRSSHVDDRLDVPSISTIYPTSP